jgi:hypothetical protein
MQAAEFLATYDDITIELTHVRDYTERMDGYSISRREWLGMLSGPDGDITFSYFTGIQENDPDTLFALYSIASDCAAGSQPLEDFLDEYGTDHVKEQIATWRACEESAQRFREWMDNPAMWDDFLTIEPND